MSNHSHEPDLNDDTPPAMPTHPLWLANLTRAGYTPLLERLVAGSKNEDLPEALEMVVQTVEAQVDGMIGSILLLDKTTQQLRHGAGGRLIYWDGKERIFINFDKNLIRNMHWERREAAERISINFV